MEQSGGDDHVKGYFWLLVTYVCGTVFYLVSKVLLSLLERDVFIVWWYGLGMVCHIGYGLFAKSIAIESIRPRERRLLAVFVAIDMISTIAMFSAIKLMDPGVVSFIAQSQIMFVLLFGNLLLGEVLAKREVVAASVIIAGIVLMLYRSPQVPVRGGLILLVSNVAAALVLIIVRHIGGTVGTLTLARLRTLSLFIGFFILNMARFGEIVVPALPVLALLAIGTFFGPFLNSISIYKTIEYIPVGKVSLFRSIQPLFVTIASVLLLGTFPGIRETTGGIIMIIGSALLAYFHAGHTLPSIWPLRGIRE